MITKEEVDKIFAYHAPHDDQPRRYMAIRDAAKAFALVVLDNTKPSADQTAAIRKLRECVMTANASIALEPIALPAVPVAPDQQDLTAETKPVQQWSTGSTPE